jgi:uncharacterized membrane protein YkoI
MFRRKRMLFGGGVIAVLAAGFLLGSLTLGGAFAEAPTPGSTPEATVQTQADQSGQQEQAPSYTGSITVPQDQKDLQDQKDQKDQAGQDEAEANSLASLAKITADQAKAAAMAQYPGATIKKAELDNENGTLAYSVELTDASGKFQDIKIDAGNAKILHVETGNAEDQATGDTAGQNGHEVDGAEN